MDETIDYLLPINGTYGELLIRNKRNGTSFRTFESHFEELLNMIDEKVEAVGDSGGWYVGDGIKVKVEIIYEPEDK